MTTPRDRISRFACRPAFAASALLLLAVSGTAAAQGQSEPVFRVPVFEDVNPASPQFNDRVIERDRSQPGMPAPGSTPNNQQGGSSGGSGASGGSSGGYGRAPAVFQGGPQMPTSSSGGGGDSGGVDVNVSVNGAQLPTIFGDQGAGGSPGMPGSPGSPGMPGSSGSTGSSSSSGGSDGNGGIDVNVNVVGGPQMPTFSIPGMEGAGGAPGMPGMPGTSGSSPGMPGMPGMPGSSNGSSNGSSGGSGSSAGDGSMAGNGSGNRNGSSGGSAGGAGTVAGAGSAGGSGASGSGNSGMGTIGGGTGRGAVLDRRLEESFGVFDGMIIATREKAQSEADAAGSSVMGTGGNSGGEDGMGEGDVFGGAPAGTIIVAGGPQNSSGGGILPPGSQQREGEFAHNDRVTYPVPEDIPDGNDDDVVARQLREAAMSEPDPELREKLWDEYRKYTGLSQ